MAASDLSAFDRKALWVARSFREMSVSELAEIAEVSRQTASALENGSASPHQPSLSAIATALRFPLQFFFKPPLVPDRSVFHFRKQAMVPEYAINKSMAHAALFAGVVEGFRAFATFKAPRLPAASPQDEDAIEAAAEAFRSKIGFRPDTPISNAIKAVESAGIFVGSFDPGTMPIDGYAWNERLPLIMLSRAAPWSRKRFSVMHEAGHLILHRDFSPEDRETHANRFAGAVLVPQAVFRREFPRPLKREMNWAAVLAMKNRWGVSIQALIHRAHDLGVIDAIQYRTACIHISKYGWRTSEPGEQEPEMPQVCTSFIWELRKRGAIGALCDATGLYVEDVELALGVPAENIIEESSVIRIVPRASRKPE